MIASALPDDNVDNIMMYTAAPTFDGRHMAIYNRQMHHSGNTIPANGFSKCLGFGQLA
jgi:hypothetical protein